jgi:ribonuclease HI
MNIFDSGETLFADGGCVLKNPSDIGVVWAYCLVDSSYNLIREASAFIPLPGGTNNFAEYIALIEGYESLPVGWSGTVASDSQLTLGRMFFNWKTNGLSKELIDRCDEAMYRLGGLTPCHVNGHQTKKQIAEDPLAFWNDYVDKLCGAAKPSV